MFGLIKKYYRFNEVDLLTHNDLLIRELIAKKWQWSHTLKFRIKSSLLLRNIIYLFLSLNKIYLALDRTKRATVKFDSKLDATSIQVLPLAESENIPYYFKLKEFANELKKSGAHLLLQGSYTDFTTTPFSDFDVMVIGDVLNREVVRIVLEIDKIILKIDPLQHHGVIFIDHRGLDCYWQKTMPLIVLKNSNTFLDKPLNIIISKVIFDKSSPKLVLLNFLESITQFLGKISVKKNEIGLWDYKFFLSQLMLLPSLILNCKQIYISKANSFKACRDNFSAEAWFCIDLSTEIRESWIYEYNRSVYQNLRLSAREIPIADPQKVVDFEQIDLLNHTRFLKSIKLFISEIVTFIK